MFMEPVSVNIFFFFVACVGVLDPEELCLVNKGFKKCETHLIPEIEENIWSSAESNSLINSGSSSLASLEIDLFDDSKLSVYETSNATNATPSSCILRRENGLQNTRCEFTAEELKVLAGFFVFVVILYDK